MRVSLNAQTRHWVFTLNNWTQQDLDFLSSLEVTYLVYGFETSTTGTPHLQGYVCFPVKHRFTAARALLPNGTHLEAKQGSSRQASNYCKKEGNYVERGQIPTTGVKYQITSFIEWLEDYYAEHGVAPSSRVLAHAHPGLFLRYHKRLLELIQLHLPLPVLQEGTLRDWQIELKDLLDNEPDDRTILFFVDPDGGKGKSWFQRWYYSQDQERTQLLSMAKRDDVAHALDPSNEVFFFNIPRGGMEYCQYTILEMLKDRVIFSPKYESKTKILKKSPHVVVFSNEQPNMDAMTRDRYEVVIL